MKQAFLILLISCCVAHFSGIAQNKTTDLSFKEDLQDSCFKVVESLAFNYGMRTTIAEYKLLCNRLSDNGKFVVTLYNDWANEGRPNLIPTDTLCIFRGIIHYKGKTYKVGSIK